MVTAKLCWSMTAILFHGYRHDSHSAVNVSDNAIVTIDAFDNSYLYVAVAGTDAKVLVNLYGNAKADIEGVGIEVRQMNKNTY